MSIIHRELLHKLQGNEEECKFIAQQPNNRKRLKPLQALQRRSFFKY